MAMPLLQNGRYADVIWFTAFMSHSTLRLPSHRATAIPADGRAEAAKFRVARGKGD
ncbi:MAG: hypothetical protein RL701_2470 [Pseudomonadota bacterium]